VAAAAAATAAAAASAAAPQWPCPDNREALGAHTWHFLHAVAAYYPERPAAEDAAAARGLLEAVARLYPCLHCRAAFEADLRARPPRLASRADFAAWLCEHHNRVNAELGKPAFPCAPEALDARWRSGRPPRCGAAPQAVAAAAVAAVAAEVGGAEESLG